MESVWFFAGFFVGAAAAIYVLAVFIVYKSGD